VVEEHIQVDVEGGQLPPWGSVMIQSASSRQPNKSQLRPSWPSRSSWSPAALIGGSLAPVTAVVAGLVW
jgi:hypothetical protein